MDLCKLLTRKGSLENEFKLFHNIIIIIKTQNSLCEICVNSVIGRTRKSSINVNERNISSIYILFAKAAILHFGNVYLIFEQVSFILKILFHILIFIHH